MRASATELWVCHLGVVPYEQAVALQERIRAARQAGEVPDVLLALEHPPVYTVGRRTGAEDMPFDSEWYARRGIDVVPTRRGGKLTYHGPGQLVGYPIMAIDDILGHLRHMEQAIVAALARAGIEAGVRGRLTGVWVQDRKIASIGVHVARGVSMHGFAVNVENDLEPFTWVVPCGLSEVRMTSATLEAGRPVELAAFRHQMASALAAEHGRSERLVTPEELGLPAPLPLPAEPAAAGAPAAALAA